MPARRIAPVHRQLNWIRAVSVAAAGRREQEIARIDAALARMDEGEYGYCFKCGREIVSARLQIDPAASHCVDCAASLER